ncbi:hypothetical protein B9G55_17905 [Saccharibacillus sp. O16]|nr:hypothetical protein B9G55_17905 [Saccharibacillus sp. O16]
MKRHVFWEKTGLVLLTCLLFIPMIRAEAKGSYKAQVYPAFWMSEHPEKLPQTLSNGLVVDKAPWTPDWEDSYLPIVKKDGKTVWTAKNQDPISANGEVEFSVAENGDTVIVYESGASAGSSANIAAIHGNGQVFLRKTFLSDDTNVKIVAPNRIEVSNERWNPNWNPDTQPNAARHSGVYDVRVFDIAPNGKLVLIKSWVNDTRK